MKEIIYNITQQTEGRVVTFGVEEVFSKDNVLGIINKTQSKVLYTPVNSANIVNVTCNEGTLTISLAYNVPVILAGNELFVKLYSENEEKIDTTELAKQGDDQEATNTAIFNAVQSKLTPLEAVLTELNNGKQEMVDALATKNVQSSTDKTLSAIASDIRSIAQSPITIEGGETYEKQLFGAPTDKTNAYEQPDTPMWNLYQVMANLLNDGRFVTYGGILLAEYSKWNAIIPLQGAGAGGAYLTSDGAMYESDINHTWNDDLDGKSNRWVAYIFKNEYSRYIVPSAELCPITIHVGRKIGNITDSIGGKITEIVVSEGNYLDSVELIAENWGGNTRINNLGNFSGTLFAGGSAANVSAGIKKLQSGKVWAYKSDKIESINLPELEEISGGYIFDARNPTGNISVKTISMPKLTTISVNNKIFDAYDSTNLPFLTEWYMPNLKRSNLSAYYGGIAVGQYVTKVVVGEMETSFSLNSWSISKNPNPDVELINKNIRLYIANRVSDRTGLSSLVVTFSSSIYNILEQETKDAFTVKNWSVASA